MTILPLVVLLTLTAVGGTAACSGWSPLNDIFFKICEEPDIHTVFQKCLDNLVGLFDDKSSSSVSERAVAESARCGRELAQAARARGSRLARAGVGLAGVSPAIRIFFSSGAASDTRAAADASLQILTATKILQTKIYSSKNVTPNTFISFLESAEPRSPLACCRPQVVCHAGARYRSADGSCNNLGRPAWGSKNGPYTRLLRPRYADGIYSMPTALSGNPLPNARALSQLLFAERAVQSKVFTALNMQWGQIITHDMGSRVMDTTEYGGIQCCAAGGGGVLPAELQHHSCMPVPVPTTDPVYGPLGVRCLNAVRSVTVAREDGGFGYAEQLNGVSSYLDGSLVYGSDAQTALALRALYRGRLRVDARAGKDYLPPVTDKEGVCDLKNRSDPCYLAGDSRVNQTPMLAVVQTLLVREHNRVADALGAFNPLWSDQKLYQEARRVLVAEIQHITYQEWLPAVIGENYARYHRIIPASLYSRDYDGGANAGAINAFSHAAFRFLHSTVPGSFQMCPAHYGHRFNLRLSDHYFNPASLEYSAASLDELVRGALETSSMESDAFFSREITSGLFRSREPWGLDLIALDIQRGRDHGLASYNDFRVKCGLPRATSFQDLEGQMTQDKINALGKLYECVNDVDLFVGGALESDVRGSLFGPTFQCIVAEQFYRTRIGDRFFYDNVDMNHSFTPNQLREIKKTSMARLICDNTDNVDLIQRKAFQVASSYNPKISCHDIPAINFSPWKELPF